MIKFNAFPPQVPGDVELTEPALEQLRHFGRILPGDERYTNVKNVIHAYGQSIGYVMLGSAVDKGRLAEITEPVFEAAEQNMDVSSKVLRDGFEWSVYQAKILEGATV